MDQKYGWEILADALREAQLDLIVCVPGKPVTPVQNALVKSGHARWVNQEAAAAQYALGASACGARTALLVKQVGMNVAADALACAAPHRSGGAMIVVAGDDPDTTSSQVEGDSRRLAIAVEVPCFEPTGAADIPLALHQALELSASLQVPAVLRVTTPLLLRSRSNAAATPGSNLPQGVPFDAARWSTDFTEHRQLLLEELYALPETGAYERRPGETALRVVASGGLAAEAIESTQHDVLAVRRIWPWPTAAIAEFVDSASSPILVLEEGGPLLEDEVRANASGQPVFGRRTGHVPWAGSVDAAVSLAAAAQGAPLRRLAPRPYPPETDADLTPFGNLWEDAEALGLTPIAVDAGHCGEAIALDGGRAPLTYGLGSAIGVAAGVALAKAGPAIAVMGDMGAFHGLPGLVQVVRDQIPVIVIVEDDGAATTTGGQPTPSAAAESGQREVSLASVARSIGVDHVETVTREAMADVSLREKLRDLAQLSGPSMIIIDEKT